VHDSSGGFVGCGGVSAWGPPLGGISTFAAGRVGRLLPDTFFLRELFVAWLPSKVAFRFL